MGLLKDGKGKPFSVTVTNDNPDGIWCYSDNCFDRECAYWSAVTSTIRKIRGSCFIPERCMSCWKVNVIPQNIGQLFELKGLLPELKVAGKCGIDTRPLNKELYGGYFYFKDIDEARDFRKSLDGLINMPVTVKRGCAPIEQEYGTEWHTDKEQEELASSLVEMDVVSTKQSRKTQKAVMTKWKGFTSKKVTNPITFKDYSCDS